MSRRGILLFVTLLLSHSIAVNVDSMIQSMTLRQKIGQLITLEFAQVQSGSSYSAAKNVLVEQGFGVGSVFETKGRSCGQLQNLVAGLQQHATTSLSNGQRIPVLVGYDSVRGLCYVPEATHWPHNVGIGATWNVSYGYLMGRITGIEQRTCGIHWAFAPVADTAHEPQWGRHYEAFSSDPRLISTMIAAFVIGMETNDTKTAQFDFGVDDSKIMGAVSLKHFVGYSMPNNGRDRSDATIAPWIMERICVPPFRAGMSGGSIMINSGSVNGVRSHENWNMLTDLLRNQLQFTGLAVSDWNDVWKLSGNLVDASTRALNAGMDMAMAGKSATETLELAVAMESAVTGGRVPVSRINQAVRRVLQLKDRIGVFERPNGFKNNMGAIATAASRRVVKQATLESITLLKNNNSLPIVLQEGNRKIIVAGPTSNSIRRQCGAWLDTWRGLENSAAQHNPTTLVAGIREVVKAYKWNVEHYEGSGINNGDGSSWPAINSAKDADYIIVAVGEDPHPEGVDPISDLTLPGPQMEFARQIADAAKQAYRILVVISGRPRTFEQLIPKYDAILYAYLPCYDGGSAIAEVLVGQHPPSGKLPFPYPMKNGNQRLGLTNEEYRWPLGHGLSYTTFEYSGLNFPAEVVFQMDLSLIIKVEVTNAGNIAAAEVVILTFDEPSPEPQIPKVTLVKRFTKVFLQPKERRTITFSLQAIDFRGFQQFAAESTPRAVPFQIGSLKDTLMISFTAEEKPSFAVSTPDVFPELSEIGIYLPPQPPVAPPVKPPVQPPIAPPVAPPVAPPIEPPVLPPIDPPKSPPVAAPVAAPARPPIVMTPPTSPPTARPAPQPREVPTMNSIRSPERSTATHRPPEIFMVCVLLLAMYNFF